MKKIGIITLMVILSGISFFHNGKLNTQSVVYLDHSDISAVFGGESGCCGTSFPEGCFEQMDYWWKAVSENNGCQIYRYTSELNCERNIGATPKKFYPCPQ